MIAVICDVAAQLFMTSTKRRHPRQKREKQAGLMTYATGMTAKRICKEWSLCQRVTGTNSHLSTANVNHCPWSGGQSQVTLVTQRG